MIKGLESPHPFDKELDQGKSKPQVHFPCATPGALTLTPSITQHAPYSPAPTAVLESRATWIAQAGTL